MEPKQSSLVEESPFGHHRCPFWLVCLRNRGPWFRWWCIPFTREPHLLFQKATYVVWTLLVGIFSGIFLSLASAWAPSEEDFVNACRAGRGEDARPPSRLETAGERPTPATPQPVGVGACFQNPGGRHPSDQPSLWLGGQQIPSPACGPVPPRSGHPTSHVSDTPFVPPSGSEVPPSTREPDRTGQARRSLGNRGAG